MKALIFDSSSIITLAMDDMLWTLPKLKEGFDGEFFITPHVKREIIDTPLRIKRFELEALNISSLINDGTIKISNPDGLNDETERIKGIANSSFISNREKMKLFHEGESSCLALSNLLNGHECLMVIDERTARMFLENPENLKELLESKLHAKISMNMKSEFKNFRVIRSSELLLVALKKEIINLPSSRQTAIDALLYASKYKGCSISSNEIEKAKTMIF